MKRYFGIVLATLFLFYFAPRYTTVKAGDILVKQDRWSGESWRFVDNQWKRIVGEDHDWDKIDKALTAVVVIASDTPSRTNALDLLRKKDPILKDLSHDDLLERIKLVYSKQIFVNMYLDRFLKLEKKNENQEKER